MAVIAKIHDPNSQQRRQRRLKYVQTLPTLCTLGNLICGFGALHLCLRAMWAAGANSNPIEVVTLNNALVERLLPSHLVVAAYLVFLAMIFDALDGRLARWTRHTTDFGAQLDSLADVVSFGVVPPLIMLALLTRQLHGPDPLVVTPFSEHLVGRITWMMAAVYVVCAALRLARFNVENEPVEQAHQRFQGLPSPGAAGALCSLIILHDHVYFYSRAGVKLIDEQGGAFSNFLLWSLPAWAMLFSLLMVSRFPYVHLVNKYLRRKRSFADMVKFVILAALIVMYQEITLTALIVGYALSGAIVSILRRTVTSPNLSAISSSGENPATVSSESSQQARG